MKTNKALQLVARMGQQSAIRNGLWCRGFLHQPKVPTKLLAMKNVK